MVGESNQHIFLIQIDSLSFADFEISEFEISRFDCILLFTGIVHETEKTGKSYAVFSIRVVKKFGEDEEIWDVYRRYSDFHDLQMIMAEKVGS